MRFIQKNWILLICILILLISFYLIIQKWVFFSFPKGGLRTILSLTIVGGIDFILSKINKKYGENYTRRIDRIFIYITVPVIIFISVGLFQKIQQRNFFKELQNIAESRTSGISIEKKIYTPLKYGEFTPFLEMINYHYNLQTEKEEEYLTGLDEIYPMISSENLYSEALRNKNREKLNNLLLGIEKYKVWTHSDMKIKEEKIKKMEYGRNVIEHFRKKAKSTLELHDTFMNKFKQLITNKIEVINFVDNHIEQVILVDGEFVWTDPKLKIFFDKLRTSVDNDLNDLSILVEKFEDYNQKHLEKASDLLTKDTRK